MDNRELLFEKLNDAAQLVKQSNDIFSDYFSSSDEFSSEIEKLALLVKKSNKSPVAYIRALVGRKKAKYTWCAPSFDLDDYLANAGLSSELGTQIYALL